MMTATCRIEIWEFFKTFAGPLAIIFASLTAAWITYKIGMIQVGIARGQADTALDQLRYSLFEKRYAIYVAARNAIAISFERRDEDRMPTELNALFLHFEEARFFFPDKIHSFLDQLRNEIRTFLQKNYLHRKKVAQHSNTQDASVGKVLLDEQAELLTLQEQLYVTSQMLPKIFADVFTFPQLTRDRID